MFGEEEEEVGPAGGRWMIGGWEEWGCSRAGQFGALW